VINPVQVRPWREIIKSFKVTRTQFSGNGMFLVQPFPQVDQLAAVGAKWTPRLFKPGSSFPASRASDNGVLTIRHGSIG
jgi:hypothetical protein